MFIISYFLFLKIENNSNFFYITLEFLNTYTYLEKVMSFKNWLKNLNIKKKIHYFKFKNFLK